MKKIDELLNSVEEYYTDKVKTYGAVSKGVDWNSRESQVLRFNQLLKVIQKDRNFSVNDYGCGYGFLYEHMSQNYNNFSYYGCDISESMIAEAEKKYSNSNIIFEHSRKLTRVSDYSIASGIFNVKLSNKDKEWLNYIIEVLCHLNEMSGKGFSFNCLTSYSDRELMRDDLFYANPCEIFDYCKKNFSKNIALLHDYNLYEFTILVRKDKQ